MSQEQNQQLDKNIILQCSDEERLIPLLPLRGLLVFPYMVIHLDVGREKSINAIDEAMLHDREIFLVTQREAQTDEPREGDLYQVGTIAEIKQLLKLPGGTFRVLVEGLRRGRIKRYLSSEPFIQVAIDECQEKYEKTAEVEAMMRTITNQFEEYVKVGKKVSPETAVSIVSIDDPGRLADIIAAHINLRVGDKQAILEAFDPVERLQELGEILSREMEILDLERKINMRDPTRGGLATTLNELAVQSARGILIQEEEIPFLREVVGACEMLGLDPLYLANEGKVIVVVAPEVAGEVLEAMRALPEGRGAVEIGKVIAEEEGLVLLETELGAARILGMLEGEPLPRIC